MSNQVRETIVHLFRQKKQMQNIGEDDSYFDLGVSSLTIIELQISIENALEAAVPTSELMRLSTMKEWIDIYSARAASKDEESSPATIANA